LNADTSSGDPSSDIEGKKKIIKKNNKTLLAFKYKIILTAL